MAMGVTTNCAAVTNGRKSIDLANDAGRLDGPDWNNGGRWCSHDSAKLTVGDFDGDGYDDLLCRSEDGIKWIAFRE